jgi:hypothetical protein
MPLHHMALKSALAKYSELVAQGKSAEEIKAAIAADEKGFGAEAQAEIFAALGEIPEVGQSQSGAGDQNTGNENSQPGSNDQENKDQQKPSEQSPAVENKKSAAKYIVKSPFRDINDWNKQYAVGSDASHFIGERLKGMLEAGLVEKK